MEIYTNPAYPRGSNLELSVLIPFFRDNPSELLEALCVQSEIDNTVEILIYDDGTQNQDIQSALKQIAQTAPCPVKLIFEPKNQGRSFARNQLTAHARASFVLFLDADMLPQSPTFLCNYIEHIRQHDSDILFGGFSVRETVQSEETRLHQAFSQHSDCLDANVRANAGPQYVCSSNLAVRKHVLQSEPFDPDFKGWGWEDSEWAARVNKRYKLHHIENPALHLGLESAETLLNRFRDSAENYVRFTTKHPDVARNLNLYKMSQTLRKIPGQKLMRPSLAFIVRLRAAPTRLRLLALKLWRASWYAEAFS